MPALFIYLLKVNITLLLFCAGYYLVLRQLTFYNVNRLYLVTAVLFATVYPQINLSGLISYHQELAVPVQTVVENFQTPAENFFRPVNQAAYWQYIAVAFWFVTILFAFRLSMRLYSLYLLHEKSKAAEIYGHQVRLINGKAGPFSFWKHIYVNPANYEPADLKAILLHEQVHVSEWHTVDVLLAELSIVFYWFNPGVWLLKRAIRENIEFITDGKILNSGVNSEEYQFSLINVNCTIAHNAIVNHFNISTIKKRIIMMNTENSSRVKLIRYLLLIPVVVALSFVFNISRAGTMKKDAIKVTSPTIGKINKIKPDIIYAAKARKANNVPASESNSAAYTQKKYDTAPVIYHKHTTICKKKMAKPCKKSINK